MKSFLRTFALHLISVFLVLGVFVAYAITYPGATPGGETPGGKFMEYFNKILVNTGASADGTVKQSASIGNASNPNILTINGNNLQINSVATSETTCSSVGLLARDNDGVLLACQTISGIMTWKKVLLSGGGGQGGKKVFTSNGNFTVPAGVTRVWVTGIGAGGSGGFGSWTAVGPPGGGYVASNGGYAGTSVMAQELTVTPGVTHSIIIGQPAYSPYGYGMGDGGNTSFGALLTLPGGIMGPTSSPGYSGLPPMGIGLNGYGIGGSMSPFLTPGGPGYMLIEW